MISSSSSAASYDPRLLEAVEEIRAAREAGLEPSREELLARYPDLAAELGRLFDTLQGIHNFPPDDLLLRTVGNYHLLAEVARGGMGVIYQAVQIDLGRPVALKVLSAGSTASSRSRQRFRQEASVAAQLHHTHIVPVFGTACADGHEAYAMPFIDGPSLAEALRDLRHDEARHPISQALLRLHHQEKAAYFRQMAELALQAADALAHAHRHGVLHRDVKPANLLVERGLDGRPHLWLHDFGLARLAGAEDFDRPGEAFGTRGYQSPEQAQGRIEAIDERSDVYSLGVTLFELVTLKRPDESDEDVRKVEPSLPVDLALIVAKCRQVRPEDRYPSAEAVAEDLRRFLHDYPVHARRPGWRRHLLKWTKRHRRSLTAAALSFVFTALVGAVLLVRAYQAERAARRAAEDREELAAQAVATYSPLVDDVLLATPGMRERQRHALEQACAVHERLLEVRPGEISRRRWLAQVSWRLGRVLAHLSQREEAEVRYRQSIELYEGLVRDQPKEPLHRLDLIRSVELLSGSRLSLGRPDEASQQAERMLDLARQAAKDFPDDRRVLDALACYLGSRGQFLLRLDQVPGAAEKLFREGLDLAQQLRQADDYRTANNVAGNQRWLAVALDHQGKRDDALQLGRDALTSLRYLLEAAIQGKLPTRKLDIFSYGQELRALTTEQLERLLRHRQWGELDALMEQTRQLMKVVAESNPAVAEIWTKELAEFESHAAAQRKKRP